MLSFFNPTTVAHRKRELPHDDFRRPHYDYRRPDYDYRFMHDDYRRFYDDRLMTFVSRVPAPAAFRNKTSGGIEKSDNNS